MQMSIDSFLSQSKLYTAKIGDISIRTRILGQGEPLLLLHGYPQTHIMWHKIAWLLKDKYTLVMPDLRGYGGSSKPLGVENYTKRAMAADMAGLMTSLGFNEFLLCGHDRGGRVSHRLAYDNPTRVKKLAVLDIAPPREMYNLTGEAFAKAYWHWFFLILPAPFPENMINFDREAYWKKKCGSGSAGLTPFASEALHDYLTHFTKETVHASCDDYRASATLDIAHDDAETMKLPMPLLALWGEHGAVNKCFDVLDLWRKRAENVQGKTLPTGHYMAEEQPEMVARELIKFFEN
jgi:haloacetate dehalogenase